MRQAQALEMPRQPKRNDITVKIAADVYRKAKIVSVHRDITLAEYLTDLLKKPVERDYQKLRQEIAKGESEESASDN